jgi:hypothetical protein
MLNKIGFLIRNNLINPTLSHSLSVINFVYNAVVHRGADLIMLINKPARLTKKSTIA